MHILQDNALILDIVSWQLLDRMKFSAYIMQFPGQKRPTLNLDACINNLEVEPIWTSL